MLDWMGVWEWSGVEWRDECDLMMPWAMTNGVDGWMEGRKGYKMLSTIAVQAHDLLSNAIV